MAKDLSEQDRQAVASMLRRLAANIRSSDARRGKAKKQRKGSK